MKLAFIKDHLAGAFPVELCCLTLGVSRSGYYAAGRPVSARRRRHADLAAKARAAHEENRRVYGSPRVHRALRAQGECVSENTVAKLLREQGIRAKVRKAFVPRTTDSSHGRPVAENLLGRDFGAGTVNRKWAADITYVPTGEGWLYVAAVLDLCSRKVIGWSMAEHMREELVGDALKMALSRRGLRPGDSLPGDSLPGVRFRGIRFRGQRLRGFRGCCTTATAACSTRPRVTRNS